MTGKDMNLLTLRFSDREREREFLADYDVTRLRHVRSALVIAMLIYGAFGALDQLQFPGSFKTVWLIRFTVVLPLCFAVLALTSWERFRPHTQTALALLMVAGGLGIIMMTLLAGAASGHRYYTGLIILIMYSTTFLAVRFLYAAAASWLLVALYVGSAAWIDPLPAPVFWNNSAFLVTAGLLGSVTSYHLELFARQDFAQRGALRALEERQHAIEKTRLREAADKAEFSLAESEEKFRTLSETTGAAIFIHQGGKLLYANPAGVAMTGFTYDELRSMDFWHLVHPESRDLVLQRAKARFEKADLPAQYEIKYINKSGAERWAILSAGLIRYDGRPAVIGTLFDITDLKEAEEEKARLYDENMRASLKLLAEQKRNVREKEKMIRDLHDGLGGSIMNIGALSQVAFAQAGSEPVRKTLTTIGALAADGLAEIRMLMQSLDVADVSWDSLAAALRQHGMAVTEPHGIEFTMEATIDAAVPPPGSLVYLNVFRIFKESITNVVKHAAARSVFAFMRAGAGKVRLTIQDDGRGLGGGSGRGLPSMQKRAEEIGGTLVITSGSGTLVVFELDTDMPQKSPCGVMETRGGGR